MRAARQFFSEVASGGRVFDWLKASDQGPGPEGARSVEGSAAGARVPGRASREDGRERPSPQSEVDARTLNLNAGDWTTLAGAWNVATFDSVHFDAGCFLTALGGCGGKNGLIGNGGGATLTSPSLTPIQSQHRSDHSLRQHTQSFDVIGQYSFGNPQDITSQMTWAELGCDRRDH